MSARLFDFRCRTCGTERVLRASKHERDPGTILCSGCHSTVPLSWWRSRSPDPFVKPDTVAMGLGPAPEFGPTAAELAELGVPWSRRKNDLESMQMKDEAPPMNRDAKKQLRLI